jgi:hypothetical protein
MLKGLAKDRRGVGSAHEGLTDEPGQNDPNSTKNGKPS